MTKNSDVAPDFKNIGMNKVDTGLTMDWICKELYELRAEDMIDSHGLATPILRFKDMIFIDDTDMTITIDKDAMIEAGYRVKLV